MARLTIAQSIGANSVIATSGTFGSLTATSGNPVLAIPFSDLSGLLDTTTTDFVKWFSAILLKYRLSLATDGTQDNGISISTAIKQFTVFDGANVVGYAFDVTMYLPDNVTALPDPDNIVANV